MFRKIFIKSIMLKQVSLLSLVLIFGLVGWSVYQKQTWSQDYTKYQADYIDIPPLDSTFQSYIDPNYFQQATIITNDTHLRCPEDIEIDSQGTIYAGLIDGSIVTVTPQSNSTTTIVSHPQSGRIFGLALTSNDSTLFYATEKKGLVQLDIKTRQFQYLLEEIEGKKFAALNGVAIDEDNQVIYMTDSGPIPINFATKEVMLGHRAGRVIKYDIKTKKGTVFLDDLAFPNGIVYEKKTHSIIFAQFNRNRIWKHSLADRNSGFLVLNLFGYVDNLKLSDNGDLLASTVITRDALSEFTKDKPELRKFLMYFPEKMMKALMKKRAGGIRINAETDQIMEYMLGAPSKISFVSTIHQRNGKTYFASLMNPTVLVLNKNNTKKIENKEADRNVQL